MSRRLPALTGALALSLTLAFSAALASSASAAAPAAAWGLDVTSYPTDFSAADTSRCNLSLQSFEAVCDTYVTTVTNVGAKATTFHSVTIEDALPAGVSAHTAGLLWTGLKGIKGHGENEDLAVKPYSFCTVVPLLVRCTVPAAFFEEVAHTVAPDETLKLWVNVTVDEPVEHPGPLTSTATVSGGGVPGVVESSAQNTLQEGNPPFGLAGFASPLLAADGTPETQAGAHPYELATNFDIASVLRETPEGQHAATSVHDIRDVILDLPLGLAGSALSAPTCPLHLLAAKGEKQQAGVSACPPDSILGHIHTYPTGFLQANSPIYNIVPEHGVAAEFGLLSNANTPIILYASIAPTPAGYVLRTTSPELVQVPLLQVTADIYGDPAARARESEKGTPYATSPTDVPTFTNPESCSGEPLKSVLHMDSWSSPGSHNPDGSPNFTDPSWVSRTFESPPVSGCAQLQGLFNPQFEVKPESTQADSPTGLQVNLSLPQAEGPEALGTPPLKDAVVVLPEGITVNPSQANGRQACTLAQVGISAAGVPDAAPPSCPDASKIGTVELETPALASEACKEPGKGLGECPSGEEREKTPLKGSIYVAKQFENPFNSLLAIYIVINDPRTGVIVKLPGEVKANETTGQLTTVVPNSPQFPFSELRTHFFGGATASLRTPAVCGTYTLTSELTPWSAPESGPPATPSSPFEITQGPGGGACAHSPGEEPNAPSFGAGAETPTAGAYSPVIVHLNREDGSQNFSQISVTLPPGASGKIAGIPKCSDAQIAAAIARSHPGEGALEAASPSCPASAAIGTVTVGAGAGPHPFYVTGSAYLAGPYKGAPFSAVFITPAIAGPFDLGVVVVRAGLYIDPATAQVTTKADPLPSILQGIPLDLRSVTVNVSRPSFTLNGTNCTPLTVTGQETSTLGQLAPLSSRFQVGGCQSLPFRPKLSASVAGKATKANGTSFAVNVSSAGLGQANIAKVALTLPKALPSRLSTIQKACVASVFEVNPAACDEGSVIGMAAIHTPLLQSPLSGPAYLVSHGGAAFPDVEFVLQGEGVTLVLDGKTDIKKGITYSRFESAPDAPFTSFETLLPAGPHSALTANVPEREHFSLCKSTLVMPTIITAQNGAVIKQNTKVALKGCKKVKKPTRAQQLNKALKACHKLSSRAKRARCQKAAQRRYGAVKKKRGRKG
jgi:hypothetical protein